jgi:hypothetical protein
VESHGAVSAPVRLHRSLRLALAADDGTDLSGQPPVGDLGHEARDRLGLLFGRHPLTCGHS